jgi:hypothetical protein
VGLFQLAQLISLLILSKMETLLSSPLALFHSHATEKLTVDVPMTLFLPMAKAWPQLGVLLQLILKAQWLHGVFAKIHSVEPLIMELLDC